MKSYITLFSAALCLIATSAWGFQADDLTSLRKVQRDYLQSVKPILKRSCGNCHWNSTAEADLDFSHYETLDEILNDASKWKKVIRRVTDGDMPPDTEDPLPDSDKEKLLSWIDHLLNTVDCTNINPGRVTIRRLNRIEYRNTVRDLVGVDYEPSVNFRGDDVGYGFDNVADVLSLPPILMEKYLDAAQAITNMAIVDQANPKFSISFSGNQFATRRQSRTIGSSYVFFTNDSITRKIDFEGSGEYVIRVRAYGDQVGDEPCKMGILIDRQQIAVIDVPATDEKAGEYEIKVEIEQGNRRLSVAFLNDAYYPKRKLDRNLHVNRVWIEGPINLSETHRAIFFVPAGENPSQQRSAAQKIIARFASRAFRRPLKNQEFNRLLQLFDEARNDGDSFEAAVKHTLQAILISPHFLYKVEAPVGPLEKTRNLTAYESATALSYFLWSTMPDDELFYQAFDDELLKPAVYRSQVERMLKDKRSEALVENFAAQWLQLRALQDMQPDPELYPGIDLEMRQDMIRETKMLFADILERDASVLELLNAKYTFVNERLARHYGITDVAGDQFVKVQLDGLQRGGLLTQASILTLTSNPNRTSPVKRGKWILENLLGEEPKFPDPSVMALEDQSELVGTLRERMEQHRKDPNCAACHLTMDALGFSLEHYDAVGRWRDKDGDLPIDDSSVLPDGTEFSGGDGLRNLVSGKMKQQFLRCFTEKLLIYALGRGLQYYDECTVDRILKQTKDEDYRLSSFVRAVTESPPFVQRSGPSAGQSNE